MKTDIEIAHQKPLLEISEIAKKINIDLDKLEGYGKNKAKINLDILNKTQKGKLILVTSVNPTPYGEGKTTMSIGISDGLNRLNKNSIVVLREPSLGPVFGMKGGATGGGYSQVVPMEDINLHFTGDMHAITSANNLLCAVIDNHLFQGNELGIKNVIYSRCLDVNDRSLRNITVSNDTDVKRDDHFVITVASEIMAILCLATSLDDLKTRLGNITIGYDINDNLIYTKDLKCEDAMTIILKDAIKPNLVQTLEGNPAIIHGGPFANIAHGCNSVIATKLGLQLGDYVVTEAGFGADLGAEKFLDIKCPTANLKPNLIVINVTIRSVKYNGGCSKEDLKVENIDYIKNGICNLQVHIENMKKYSKNIIVCLNRFDCDTDLEVEYVKNFCTNFGVEFEVCTSFKDGSDGSIDIAKKIVELCESENIYKPLYDYNDSIKDKIKKICTEIYRANDVVYSDDANKLISSITKNGYNNLPICIAKTQYSLSDDPKKLGHPTNFNMTVRDIKLCSGANFIVVYMGNIMTMPGLGKNSSYQNMEIDKNGNIKGLF